MEDDFTRQADEVEALTSIYPEEWKVENKTTRSYSIRLIFVTLYIRLPHNYPSQAPPTYQLSGPELTGKEKREIAMLLDNIYLDNIGEPVIFQWVEALRNYVCEREKVQQRFSLNLEDVLETGKSDSEGSSDDPVPITLIHGNTITDRKSTFQGHGALVTSVEEVKAVLSDLKANRKISGAKHNIYAYRIKRGKSVVKDFDDDGEAQAGRRLLHLLELMDVDGAIVVVTRWYGGLHLGQDRFKHYNNAGRQILLDLGYS